MRAKMNLFLNGESRVPPGFRFHPTEEELLQYYLKKKVACEKIDLDVILEVDLNKLEPWDIQEKCKIGTSPQNDWYFFSHKDKKYPTGIRANRATAAGFWKATGRDKMICSNFRWIGMRKTLVFYKGRAPHGQKSDWIMHEYRFDESTNNNNKDSIHVANVRSGDFVQGWVVCKMFKKKNHLKDIDNAIKKSSSSKAFESHSSIISMLDSPSDYDQHDRDDQGTLEQIFKYMGSKPQNINNNINNIANSSSKLPSLESPNNNYNNSTTTTTTLYYQTLPENDLVSMGNPEIDPFYTGLSDWGTLEMIVACHLNGQSQTMTSIYSPSLSSDHLDQSPPLI